MLAGGALTVEGAALIASWWPYSFSAVAASLAATALLCVATVDFGLPPWARRGLAAVGALAILASCRIGWDSNLGLALLAFIPMLGAAPLLLASAVLAFTRARTADGDLCLRLFGLAGIEVVAFAVVLVREASSHGDPFVLPFACYTAAFGALLGQIPLAVWTVAAEVAGGPVSPTPPRPPSPPVPPPP